MSMRIKLVSDGTPRGTKVVNAETGEEIEHVVSAQYEISKSLPIGALYLIIRAPLVEIEASAEVHVLPRLKDDTRTQTPPE
jgi:hypothetical protein